MSDPIKIVLFIAVFAALLLLGRKLSSSGSSHTLPGSSVPPEAYGLEIDEQAHEEVGSQPALVGAELPFPISMPPITRSADGFFNRPEVLNYYFSKTDLVHGPADPKSFCDEFYMELKSPADGNVWTVDYLVATPEGLRGKLDSSGSSALHLDREIIIVSRWDVAAVLQEVMKDIMGNWAHSDADDDMG